MHEANCSRCGRVLEEMELTCLRCGSSSKGEMSAVEIRRLKKGGRYKRFAYLFVAWSFHGFLIFLTFAVLTKFGRAFYKADPLLSIGVLIALVPVLLTGTGVAWLIRTRSNRRGDHAGERKRFPNPFLIWAAIGLVVLLPVTLVGSLTLAAYEEESDSESFVIYLVLVLPVVLLGIAIPLFLRARVKKRPSPMRIQDWKAIEFDEVPDMTPEEVAQRDASLRRLQRTDRRRNWTDSPNADLDL